jgi:hypothetical protein
MLGETVMLRSTSIILNFVVLIIVVPLTSPPCLALIKGDMELLKIVALKHKSNFESILTWKSEAFEERTSTQGDWYDYLMKNKCTFAYDRLRGAVRWNKEPQENHCINHGEPQIDILANYNSEMFKDGYYYEYTGCKQPHRNNEVAYNLVIDSPRAASGWQEHGLDPRYLFNELAGPTVHDYLMFLYNNANVEGPYDHYVKREGDLVTLQVSPDETRTERHVYDLSKGGNLVEYYNKSPRKVENTKSYTYEEKSGIWILKSYKWTNINLRKNGEVFKSTRTINWSNSVVNVPFGEDEFTVEKLGVKHGDNISDHRVNRGYRYEGVLAEVPPKPQTLTGKQLPQTDGFGITLSPEITKGKIILLCFWDMKQRPARQCVQELANRMDDLQEKGVVSVLIHASPAEPNALKEWMTKFKIPSTCGVITDDAGKVETIRNKWGVRGLPWLVLTDKKHIVRAEGFGISELDERITALIKE